MKSACIRVSRWCVAEIFGNEGFDAVEVERWAHFLNVFMLGEKGKRINRRNAQDIRTPLYDHQIPPGAANVVHYSLEFPQELSDHITIEFKLQYPKFDQEFMQIAADSLGPNDHPLRGHQPGRPYRNPLPIVTMASDRIALPVRGIPSDPSKGALATREIDSVPVWQRWNVDGIGLLLNGKAELKQAEAAFVTVEGFGRFDGPLNSARVFKAEGRLDEAVAALARAAEFERPAPPAWTMSWLAGTINAQQGLLDSAIENFKSVLGTRIPSRKFDFSRDCTVIGELGQVLFQRAQQVRTGAQRAERRAWLREAIKTFEQTLELDSENSAAHYNLELCYRQLGERSKADHRGLMHMKYERDDSIAGEMRGWHASGTRQRIEPRRQL